MPLSWSALCGNVNIQISPPPDKSEQDTINEKGNHRIVERRGKRNAFIGYDLSRVFSK